MREKEKLLSLFPEDGPQRRNAKTITRLYEEVANEGNREQLDEMMDVFISLYESVKDDFFLKASGGAERKFSEEFLDDFYVFLLQNGKRESTAYDYCKRISRICKIKDMDSVWELLNPIGPEGPFRLNELIHYFTMTEEGKMENAKVHNSYGASLKRFRDFLISTYRYAVTRDNEDGTFVCLTLGTKGEESDIFFNTEVEEEKEESRDNGHFRTIRLFDMKGNLLKCEKGE